MTDGLEQVAGVLLREREEYLWIPWERRPGLVYFISDV